MSSDEKKEVSFEAEVLYDVKDLQKIFAELVLHIEEDRLATLLKKARAVSISPKGTETLPKPKTFSKSAEKFRKDKRDKAKRCGKINNKMKREKKHKEKSCGEKEVEKNRAEKAQNKVSKKAEEKNKKTDKLSIEAGNEAS